MRNRGWERSCQQQIITTCPVFVQGQRRMKRSLPRPSPVECVGVLHCIMASERMGKDAYGSGLGVQTRKG